MKKSLALLLGAVMVMGTLVGCGGSTTETKADTADTAGDEKVWMIATDTVFRPFEYTNEKGEFVGIDVDILAAIAEDQGFKYELNSLGWDAAVLAVQTGQADAIIAGATIKQERIDSGWIFSDGYYDATQTFVVAAGSDIDSFEDLAGKNVAVPGTSEHQLGIAVDINADEEKSKPDEVYNWLAENAHKYGFINRYPSDKTEITGIIYEPWHYRYVGRDAAEEIYKSGLCLEEYIETLE